MSILRTRFAALFFLASLGACSDDGLPGTTDPGPEDPGGDVTRNARVEVDERAMRVVRTSESDAELRIPLRRIGTGGVDVRVRAELVSASGTRSGAMDVTIALASDAAEAVLPLPEFVGFPTSSSSQGDLASWVIQWTAETPAGTLSGRRSLWEAWDKIELVVLGASESNVDGGSRVRVIASNPATREPLAERELTASIVRDGSARVVFTGRTDAFGMLSVPVDALESELGDVTMQIRLAAVPGTEEVVEAPIRVVREQRILITTDKPIYQPGQRIHLRALALSRPSLRPAAGRDATIVISDAKGNKIFRETRVTDEFGVLHLDFPLADQLNLGDWSIAVEVDGVTTERTVRVDRYVLPKFGVTLSADRGHYRPGDTALIDIDARYFFGQPVANGRALIQPWTFDVGFEPLPAIEVALDGAGLGVAEVRIPDWLAGQPLEQGNAIVRVDVSVTDATEHTQTATRTLIVANQDLLLSMIPASRVLPGRDTTFYVLTRSPAGRPLAAECTVVVDDGTFEVQTDRLGYAEVVVGLPAGTHEVELACIDETRRSAQRTFRFATGSADSEALAVISDGALYDVGESVELDIVTAGTARRVFVDVVRDGQTLLTDAIDVANGRAAYTLDLSPDMTGTLRIDAWYVTEGANIVRGHRTVYVQDARQLAIDWQTDRDEYRPGEPVELTARVRDADGQGVRAALGVTIVDEAVFALQDMQPGMERVYFQLESELLSPRFNVYGWSIQTVAAASEFDRAEREAAAAVILAGTDEGAFQLNVNSFRDASVAARRLASEWLTSDASRIRARIDETSALDARDFDELRRMERRLNGLPKFHDPFGNAWRLQARSWGGLPRDAVIEIVLSSAGMDETWGTADDFSRVIPRWDFAAVQDELAGGGGGWGPPWAEADAAMPSPDPDFGNDDSAPEEGGGDGPRVRSFFPETLLVAPDLITDENGIARLAFDVADSITTWRVTGLASSADGELGSSTAGIRVFQPFFIDINFPVELTRTDRVAVPVAIFNYLDQPQTVELRVDRAASGDWFTLLSDERVQVALQPGEITVRYFDVQVDRVGRHPFQVTAIGSELSDAVRRVVRVAPDGQANPWVVSERLIDDVEATFTVPPESVPDGSTLLVKIYPGMLSQVIEGIDSLLMMPSGCFEQTSSTTYPNVLVLQYLRDTDTATPELEMRALDFIAQGYQRLVSYEVPGGGFEWFGNTPAHPILTAYGLLQFTDMDRVYAVDPAVITRTRNWLLSLQQDDGRFRAAAEGIHEGATNNFRDSDLRATAYITYALLESGVAGPQIERAMAWIGQNRATATDPYTLGLIANVYLAHDARSATAREILRSLVTSRRTRDENGTTLAWWGSDSQSLYFGSGESMNMEATALILQALIRAGGFADAVEEVVDYLLANKNQFGNFVSTQATVLTLRAMLELVRNSTSDVNATVRVFLGELLAATLEVNASNADLLRQVDLTPYVEVGDNRVRIEFDGDGAMLYQIVGEYFIPWALVPDGGAEDILRIANAYDRTTLAVDETVTVTTTVTNASASRHDMVMIDLGIPPGFDPVLADFDALIEDRSIPVTRVERKGRQLVVYVYGLDAGQVLSFDWRLRATMAVTAQTPPSRAWLYYDEGVSSEAEPVTMNVN